MVYLSADSYTHPSSNRARCRATTLIETSVLTTTPRRLNVSGSLILCCRVWCFVSCSPILLEVPHFASLHDATREVCVLRSDNGVTWSEHQMAATDDDLSAVMANNFDSK